ncbi:Hsp20/alpha crystallin family protein [Candidatus Gracilibacteria bacterium]|nr:Hsp20/alpha crystallin family protein [Candidatus Gracilibacteria bacterium]NJS41250.1 Hsp20/alpha crystallin family protein [Candidatus Gracilibacteria bacterium]
MSNLLSTYIDNFFDDGVFYPSLGSRRTPNLPAINIEEFDDKYSIKVTTPGLDPKDIKVEVQDNNLNISYEHNQEDVEREKGKVIREEYSHYSFSRSISLPKNVDQDSIKATSKKGILCLSIDKLPETKPRQIDIEEED